MTEAPDLLPLLIAAVRSAGGELRLKQNLFEDCAGLGIVQHFDSEKGEYVLRFATKGSTVYFMPDEAAAARSKSNPRTSSSVAPLSDEELAAREERQEWARELGRAVAGSDGEPAAHPSTVFRTRRP